MTWKQIKEWVESNPLGLHDEVETALNIEFGDTAESLRDYGSSGLSPADETQDVFSV